MKVVVLYLDEDGYECYRETYTLEEAWKKGLGEVIEEMQRNGVRVAPMGGKVIELLGD